MSHSVERAFALGTAFDTTIAGVSGAWLMVTASSPVAVGVPPSFIAVLSLVVPPTVAVTVCSLG